MGGLSYFPPILATKNLKFWTFSTITQLILAQKQHPGPFLKNREQELSFGTKIDGIFCFIVGDLSFFSFDRGYIFPTV